MSLQPPLQDFEDFEDVAAFLAMSAPPAVPPPSLRSRLLKATAPKPLLPGFAEETPGFDVLRRANQKWTPTPFTGVDYMLLSLDKQSSIMTTLLRLAPGAIYPPHHHTAKEQCWVLEGDVRHTDGTLEAQAGDFFIAGADSDHVGITSENGCLLLLVSSANDYVL